MNRKVHKYILILICIIILGVLALFAVNKLRGHGYFSAAKNYFHYYLNKPDFSNYEPFDEEENAWYQNNTLIAHAMGGIGDMEYSNSLEAFENAMKQGYCVFEVDFSVTADNRVVCSHDFEGYEGIPRYDEYMNTSIQGLYTPLDMEQMVELLADNPNIYLMTDFKWDNSFGSDNHEVTIIMDELKTCLQKYGDISLADRVVIQIYSEENYHVIEKYGCFKNYVYTLYQYAYPIYEEIAAFCLENDIRVVTMGKERATREHVAIFDQWNIKVYSHTVNTLQEAAQQLENGVHGIYTDWILPTEMESMR